MRFNRGKFNRKGDASTAVIASSLFEIGASIRQVNITHFAEPSDITFEITVSGNSTLRKYSDIQAGIVIDAKSGSIVKIFNIGQLKSDIDFNSEAIGSNIGEEFIALEGIVLRPGEELVINTCDLTATINGENAISSLTVGSDFFDFLSGDNDVIISGENSRGMTVDVYWKDRWL